MEDSAVVDAVVGGEVIVHTALVVVEPDNSPDLVQVDSHLVGKGMVLVDIRTAILKC